MSSVKARRLIWVPIIHTSADLGSLHSARQGESTNSEAARRSGRKGSDRSVNSGDRFVASLMQMELDWS